MQFDPLACKFDYGLDQSPPNPGLPCVRANVHAGVRFAAINDSGLLGIGFSVVVVVVAALNLVLDFDFIESGVSAGAPKYMEWYGAFGLIVTLVWLYLEILRLLSKINSRN
jgi:uncharacterized YccA/Bax inhibitor family protein